MVSRIMIFISGFFSFMGVVVAQESSQIDLSFLEKATDGNFMAKLIGGVIACQIVLYGLAEGLTRISVMTSNEWDNKLAKTISDIAWILGSIIGKFGYSTPKLVIEEKAKQISSKEEEKK